MCLLCVESGTQVTGRVREAAARATERARARAPNETASMHKRHTVSTLGAHCVPLVHKGVCAIGRERVQGLRRHDRVVSWFEVNLNLLKVSASCRYGLRRLRYLPESRRLL
jgi:hypothetical protein